MAAVNRERYNTAQTVSDEQGKGAEGLRQAVVSHWEPSSAADVVTSNHQLLYCEVDSIIRFLRVMSVDIPDANADLTVYRNRSGTLVALTAAARAVDEMTTEVFVEETLNVGRDALRKDDSVYAIMVRDATSTESGDLGIYLGWMPDIFGLNADYRTF